MAISTKCPGCGAPLQVDETATSAVCQFCGASFSVNLDGVAPEFNKVDAVPDAIPPAELPATNPAEDVYNPPIQSFPPPSYTQVEPPPPPLYTTVSSGQSSSPFEEFRPLINRLTNRRMWLAIGTAIFLTFCLSCACFTFIIVRVIQVSR